jgi:serine protease Do
MLARLAPVPAALLCALLMLWSARPLPAQVDPATEPAVVAVKRAQPAVVNISTERVVKRQVRNYEDEFFNQFFGGPSSRPLTVRQTVQSLGSGFLIDASGYIVTNEHVVERAADLKISVTTSSGKTYDARYITGSAESDLALLKIEGPDPFPFLNLNDPSPNLLGESVLVLGNPLGYGNSVARGILSAKGRSVTINKQEFKNLLQTDAAINPGNSGGPIIDLNARLVGVSSVKMAFTPQGVPTQGISFAIPAEVVREKVAEFREIAAGRGPKTRTTPEQLSQKYFGLTLQDLTPERAGEARVKAGSGVIISAVQEDSPAGEAGFERGLVIFQVGRYPVTSARQVESLLEPVSTGSIVDFTIGVERRQRGQPQLQRQTVTLIAR